MAGRGETGDRRSVRSILFGLAAVLLSAVILAVILVLSLAALEQVRHSSLEKARTIARTVTKSIRGVVRYGPDQEGRVSAILEEVSRDPEVLAVGILGPDGTPLVVHGDMKKIPLVAHSLEEKAIDRGESLVFLKPFEIAGKTFSPGSCSCRQMACACSGDEPILLEQGSYTLALAMNHSLSGSLRLHIKLEAALAAALVLILMTIVWLLARAVRDRERLARRVAVEAKQRENLEALNLLAAGLAHEIKNPLGSIRGYAQLIHERSPDEKTAVLLEETDRVNEKLEEFLDFARTRTLEAAPLDFGDLVRGTVQLLAPDADALGVAIEVDPPDAPVVVEGDAAQLKELLFNLVLNALQACARGGRVRVAVSAAVHRATVAIRDDGGGIRKEDLARVFEPYFTTKEAGSGLGLAIARRIADDHGGTIDIASDLGKGTTVCYTMPLKGPRA